MHMDTYMHIACVVYITHITHILITDPSTSILGGAE